MVKTWAPIQMRQDNRATILNIIWEKQEISRASLARLTGMSRSSISGIISQLIQSKLVEEVGAGVSMGGRKPINLRFCPSAFQVLGVQVGRNETQLGVLDLNGTLLKTHSIPTGMKSEPREYQENLFATITTFIEKNSTPFLGIGVAVPFPVKSNLLFEAPGLIYPKWQGVDLVGSLKEAFSLPVYFDNDANLGALAQQWHQKIRGQHIAYIEMADGFGAGLIIDGKIFRGAQGFAGEVGHMIVNPKSSQWHRGLQGALNAIISEEALKEKALTLKELHQDTSLDENSTIDDIVEAALTGDTLACHLCDMIAEYLSIALSNILNILNLETIVVGGTLAKLGDDYFEKMKSAIDERIIWPEIKKARVFSAPMGRNQIVVGSGTQIIAALIDGTIQLPEWSPKKQAARQPENHNETI